MDWLAPLVEHRHIDDAAIEHLARGFRTWLDAGGDLSLPSCLGLAANPERVRRAWRDKHLQDAAALIVGPTTWQRAGLLADAAHQFELRRWSCWWSLPAPPPNASDLDRHLFKAMKSGAGKLPTTTRQFFNIMRERETV